MFAGAKIKYWVLSVKTLIFELRNRKRIRVLKGDITKAIGFEAIVNPANSLLLMGGGVAGAIKRVGGEEIEAEARKHAPLPVGEAVVTKAGRLGVKYVIHAPTMENPAMRTSLMKVKAATEAALKAAEATGITSILFPGMGTGIGGVKPEAAAEVMTKIVLDYLDKSEKLREVGFIAYSDDLFRAFLKAIKNNLTSS